MPDITVRDWECACGHKYTRPVRYAKCTTNLGIEATQWCPRCGKRPLIGSPHYIMREHKPHQSVSFNAYNKRR